MRNTREQNHDRASSCLLRAAEDAHEQRRLARRRQRIIEALEKRMRDRMARCAHLRRVLVEQAAELSQ